jgi:hypothetical protein
LTDALEVSFFLVCGVFCFTALDTEFLASKEPEVTFTQGKGEVLNADALLNSTRFFRENLCERVSVLVSDGVRMTADAMRFSDWDDTHTHTHSISSVVKQAVKGIFIAHR